MEQLFSNYAFFNLNATLTAWFGAFATSWTMMLALISYYESRQKEQCRSGVASIASSLSFLSTATVTAETLIEKLDNHQLKVTTVPDIAIYVRIKRAQIMSGIISAASLIVMVIFLEVGIISGALPDGTRSLFPLFCLISILISILSFIYTSYISVRLDIRTAVGELAMWEHIRSLFGG